MNNIRGLMSQDHRECDDFFVAVELSIGKKSWDDARTAFVDYREAMLAHFKVEESILFPAFEQRTGMRMGPTQVMRNEHDQMRELIAAAGAAVSACDADEYSGYAETLLIMMQQHNMKEENVLYPMCDQQLGDQSSTLLQDIKNGLCRQGLKE